MNSTPKRLFWKILAAIIPPVIIAGGGIVWLQYNRARREMLGSINTEMGLLAQRSRHDSIAKMGSRVRPWHGEEGLQRLNPELKAKPRAQG